MECSYSKKKCEQCCQGSLKITQFTLPFTLRNICCRCYHHHPLYQQQCTIQRSSKYSQINRNLIWKYFGPKNCFISCHLQMCLRHCSLRNTKTCPRAKNSGRLHICHINWLKSAFKHLVNRWKVIKKHLRWNTWTNSLREMVDPLF